MRPAFTPEAGAQPMTPILRPARRDELARLSDVCMRSKAVHGYDEAFMSACRDELTLTAEDLDDARLVVAVNSGVAVGVAQIAVDWEGCFLEKLFVDPDHLGLGIGRRLLRWCADAARALGAEALIIESDPGAVPFYEAMGARHAGEAPSGSIPGRMLPRLTLSLSEG